MLARHQISQRDTPWIRNPRPNPAAGEIAHHHQPVGCRRGCSGNRVRAVGDAAPEAGEEACFAGTLRKIPIGVFDPAFPNLSIDEMIEKCASMGVEAVEIGTGGYPNSTHCPVKELLEDPAKREPGKRNSKIAIFRWRRSAATAIRCLLIRRSRSAMLRHSGTRCCLAERLGVSVIVGFSGCPGGGPTDTMPNWVTYRWPPEYGKMLDWQWKEKVIPYWKQAAKFAREHGIHKIALEMHPNFVVYNPKTLLQLREAVGEEIGANCDLSHLFWQQCDAVEVIRMLGKQSAIFHAHMKDTTFYKENVDRYGVLNFAFEKKDLTTGIGDVPRRRVTATAPGPGKKSCAPTWKLGTRAFSASRTKIRFFPAKWEWSARCMC